MRELLQLITVYRGVALYGESGVGKSSLVNAGLFPGAIAAGLSPERLRVQPRPGEELVLERMTVADETGELLASELVPDDDAQRTVLSLERFEEAVARASRHRPILLVLDQFEELVTLFEGEEKQALQARIVSTLTELLHGSLHVKLLFVFREDYLAKVKQLMAAYPELVDQALRIVPPRREVLPTIIRGPFESATGGFSHELSPQLAERLCDALGERFGAGEASLSEVQTVCLRLWQSESPEAELDSRGVQGLLEDYLGEELQELSPELRRAAVALLGQMVTTAGTRNVISADDLVQRAHAEDGIAVHTLVDALARLEGKARLIRHERRRNVDLYEIASEFLIPWISQQRERIRQQQARRRLVVLACCTIAGVLVAAVVGALAIWALAQRSDAREQATSAASLALGSAARSEIDNRLDVALALALASFTLRPSAEGRGSMIAALEAARASGAISILHGHSDFVRSVAFSPDDRELASGSNDGSVRIWDVASRKQTGAPLGAGGADVVDVAYRPDGRLIAAATDNGDVEFWDARTRRRSGRLKLGVLGGGDQIAFSPDGRTLVCGDAQGLTIWDVASRMQTRLLHSDGTLRGNPTDVAASPDGRYAAAGYSDGEVLLWDLRSRHARATRIETHVSAVNSIAFNPASRIVASGDQGGITKLTDVGTRRQVGGSLSMSGVTSSVAFSPDGRRIAIGGYGSAVELWDVSSHVRVAPALVGHAGSVTSVAYSRDGHMLASGGKDGTVRLWDVDAQVRQSATLATGAGYVSSVAFSPDGRRLVSGHFPFRDREGGSARVWSVTGKHELGRPFATGIRGVANVAVSPDGRTVATRGGDNSVRLWDARTHWQSDRLLHGSSLYTGAWAGVAFSPDGRTLASGGRDTDVRLWSVASGRRLGRTLIDHGSIVTSVVFSPDRASLATSSLDGTIRLWDVATQRSIGHPLDAHAGGVNAVAYTPDGRTLAAAMEDNTVRLWDVASQRPIGQPMVGHTGRVTSVAFSPDGQTLASGAYDAQIRLWDVATREQLGEPLRAPTEGVTTLAFSPDGLTLVSGGVDGTLSWWQDIFWRGPEDLERRVCGLIGTGPSETEWSRYAPGIPYRRVCP